MDECEEVEIAVVTTGKRYDVAWRELELGDYESLAINEAHPSPEKCDQVARLDQQSIPTCYNGRGGD